MKFGIITLLGDNYGNRLQNYAVQEILRQYGDEIYTIKYEKKQPQTTGQRKSKISKIKPSYMAAVIQNRLKNIYHLNVSQRSPLGNLIYFLLHKKRIEEALGERGKRFREFDEQYISYESEILHISGDDEKDWLKEYQAFVCGSDQIWNPTYPTASRLAFLQFAPKEKRIAFSPSIGITDVSRFSEEMHGWIKEIPALSVREAQAVELVEQMTGRTPELLLDPTMLLPIEKWNALADAGKTEMPEQYALCYFLGNKDTAYEDYIAAQLKEKKLDRVELLNSEYPKYLSLAPHQMIYALKNASVIYTDSFHGVVFSILFHKPFVVFNRSEQGLSMNSRLSTLLKHFHLEKRMYHEGWKEDRIDFSGTEDMIKREQDKAKRYLEEALQNIMEGKV